MECRLCLGLQASVQISNDLIELIQDCCRIQIQENDDLPDKICNHCHWLLESFENFRNAAQKSDNELRNRLKSSGILITVKEEFPQYSDNNSDLGDNENVIDSICYKSDINPSSVKFSIIENVKIERNDEISVLDVHRNIITDISCHKRLEYNAEISQEIKPFEKNECDKCFHRFSNNIEKKEHKCNEKVKFFQNNCKLEKDYNIEIGDNCTKNIITLERNDISLCERVNEKNIGNINLHTQNIETVKVKNKKRKQNMCYICNKMIFTSGFRVHMLRHTKTKNHLCTYCGKAFVQASELWRHLQLHSKPKQQNIEKNKKIETVDCNVCNKTISKNYIKKHQKRHDLVKNITCDMCGNKFISKGECNSHMKSVHLRIDKTQCNICGKILATKQSYKKHLLFHSFDTLFECDLCGKKFKHRSYMVAHIRSHMRSRMRTKPFKCKLCRRTFTSRTSLISHKLQHTKDILFECDFCGKKFKHRSRMVIHIRIHTGIRLHKCKLCPKACITSTSLKSHMLSHTKQSLFECDFCGKKFNHKGNMVAHIRSHMGMKLYKCNLCLKAFSVSTTLNFHMLNHTNETPFECDFCSKKFKQKTQLVNHIRLHMGIRPYKCKLCSKAFTSSQSLNSHMFHHTKGTPFQCEVCFMKFRRKDSMRVHLKKFHKPIEK